MICNECGKTVTSGRGIGENFICTACVNLRKYESGEPGYYPCKICGDHDSPDNWMGDALEPGLCFSCSFWVRHLLEYRKGRKIVVDGNMYVIGIEKRERFAFKGFGGRKFEIEMLTDGKQITSTNMWHNGTIPKRFRPHLPDNARFVKVG